MNEGFAQRNAATVETRRFRVTGVSRGASKSWLNSVVSANVELPVCFLRFKDTIVNAKYGGHTEAVRRLLGQLPISAQSYSSSPYLDLSLFSYDDKWVSVMERPKTCGDHPIRYGLPSGWTNLMILTWMMGLLFISRKLSCLRAPHVTTFSPSTCQITCKRTRFCLLP